MSCTEIHYGKLRKIAIVTPLEEYCESLCTIKGINEKNRCTDSWIEEVKCSLSDEYIISGEDIYQIIEHTETDDGDYFNRVVENGDGTFSFFTIFYNGGTCLEEEISEGLENLKKEKDVN